MPIAAADEPLLQSNPYDELEELRLLGVDYFPATPMVPSSPAPLVDQAEIDTAIANIQRIRVRKQHAKAHAWEPSRATGDVPARGTRDKGSIDAVAGREGRIPLETDVASLLQTIAIKDALLRQLEAALLTPLPEQALLSVGLSRRAAALVANARRREAVLGLKLRACTRELEDFRKREKEAVLTNARLIQKLNATLTDLDAVSLRREVRELRADLRAALGREAQLQQELLIVSQRLNAASASNERKNETEGKMRQDMEYLRSVAVHAMSSRVADVLGAVPEWGMQRV